MDLILLIKWIKLSQKKMGAAFLTDSNIALKIVNTLNFDSYNKILEIGPGTGFNQIFI